MGTTLYVMGLADTATGRQLRHLCAPYGIVEWTHVVMDRITGQPVGIGLVQMGSRKSALQAVLSLVGTQLEGQTLRVSVTPEHERLAIGSRA